MSEIKQFKDLFPRETLEGELIPIEDVVGKEIIIKAFTLQESFSYEGSEFAVIQAIMPNKKTPITFSCGGGLILKYLKIAHEKGYFPFRATINKIKGKNQEYYVFE